MLPRGSASTIDEQPSRERGRRPRTRPVCAAGAVVVAVLVLAVGFLLDRSRIVRAGALTQTGSKDQPQAPADSSGFIAGDRQKQNDLQEKILDLGAWVLGSVNATNDPQLDAIKQKIAVQSANANYENAKLTREVGEIAILEYEEGIFKQDQAVAAGEIKLAQYSVERARASIETAESQLAKIRQASKGTAEDLSLEYSFEDSVAQAVLRERRARVELEKAQSKLELLRQYVRPKRVKELKSEVEKARSDELARQAQWEFEKLKLKKLQEATEVRDLETHEKQLLTLLDLAIPILDQLKTKLDQAEKDREPGDHLRKEIADTTGQLQALVEQAQVEEAAAKWAKLKPRVHDAATRYRRALAK